MDGEWGLPCLPLPPGAEPRTVARSRGLRPGPAPSGGGAEAQCPSPSGESPGLGPPTLGNKPSPFRMAHQFLSPCPPPTTTTTASCPSRSP